MYEEVKRIKIWRYEFTINGLLNIFLGILLIVFLFFPWFDSTLFIQAEEWRNNVIWGHLKLSSNGLGITNLDISLTYKSEVGAIRDIVNLAYMSVNPILLALGVIGLISSILLILSGLIDGGVIDIGFISNRRGKIPIIASFLAVISGAIYSAIVNNLYIGKRFDVLIDIPERDILKTISFSTFGDFNLAIFNTISALEEFRRAGVGFSYNFALGTGLLAWAIISAIAFIQNVNYLYLTNKLKLRTAWKVRFNLATFILLTFLYPIAGFIKIVGSSGIWNIYYLFFSISKESVRLVIQPLIIIVFTILLIFLIFTGVRTRGAGILMTTEEFIPLDLPPEEIARRTKLLPIY